jgi:predicted nucleic acid-binding Zn ribbon protein
MALIALKCPNCGALIPRESMKCEYCGAGLALTSDGSALLSQKQTACPSCGNPVASDAWFCVKCQTILTPNTERLNQIQAKLQFSQQQLRKQYPSLPLEPEEFVYYLFHGTNAHPTAFHGPKVVWDVKYAATEKRLLLTNNLTNRQDSFSMKDIATIGQPFITPVKNGHPSHNMQVQIINIGTITLAFGNKLNIGQESWHFYRALHKALNDWQTQKRDVRAVICSLKINPLPPPPPPPN